MRSWEGVQYTSVVITEREPTFLSTILNRVVLPNNVIPPPYTTEEVNILIKRKRKSKKTTAPSSPHAKRIKTHKKQIARKKTSHPSKVLIKDAGSHVEAGSSVGGKSKRSKSPSPDIEELFRASDEDEDSEYETQSSETESDAHTSSGPFEEALVHEDVPSFSERSCPTTPKGAIGSSVKKSKKASEVIPEKAASVLDRLDSSQKGKGSPPQKIKKQRRGYKRNGCCVETLSETEGC